MPSSVSPLGPIDPSSVAKDESGANEQEKKAPWIVRKLVGSMTGRIVMSSYESLRAAGTGIVCLSPWGDSSPLLLPCIRFRDLAVHAVVAGTGGMAAVAAPVMGPVSDVVISTVGDSILVELALHAGTDLTVKVADDIFIDKPIDNIASRIKSKALQTTSVKVFSITLKYKDTVTDASLGFYRSSMHKDTSLFSSVKDYLAVEKGWFSPYLFASGRRPIIPRTMKPDVVFCHGPFLTGDYRIGERLLAESSIHISLCHQVPKPNNSTDDLKAPRPSYMQQLQKKLSLPKIQNIFKQDEQPHPPDENSNLPPKPSPSPEPKLASIPDPDSPRRIVIMLVGIKPHRKLWSTSHRPGESVIQYIVMNGCPAIVVPARTGAPLVAWDTATLEWLWKVPLPTSSSPETEGQSQFEGIVKVMWEYLDLCVEWERAVIPKTAAGAESEAEEVGNGGVTEERKKEALREALRLLVAAAIRTKDCKEAVKEIESDRAGIAMWRIP